MKILIVEDEPKLNKGLVLGLQNRGYAIDSALDGEHGEYLASVNNYDLIILDLMLPKRSGLEVCANLRTKSIATPILFLTAKDDVSDKIFGLDAGGDDYLVKPFAFEELVARIRALLRRPPQATNNDLRLDDLCLDTRAHRLLIHNQEIALTLREYGILEYLLRNLNTVVTREALIEHVWDQFYDSLSNVVDVHLKNLRKKLPPPYANRIQTIRGQGYRLA